MWRSIGIPVLCRCCSESHGHAFDAGHHGGQHAFNVADQFEFGVSAQQHFEEDAGFEPGQLGPDARVFATAEGDMRVRVARQLDFQARSVRLRCV
jgi:hypothetical protein